MLRPLVTVCLSLGALSGCADIVKLFSEEDWREGDEEIADCIKRVRSGYHEGVIKLLNSQERRQPTYTFDITKASFGDIKELTIPDQGSEKGSVMVSGFKAPPRKLRMFMNMRVDKKGAFFMGVDPAYYRVLGEPIALADVFVEGCQRQRAGMRFLNFTFRELPSFNEVADEALPKSENEN